MYHLHACESMFLLISQAILVDFITLNLRVPKIQQHNIKLLKLLCIKTFKKCNIYFLLKIEFESH